MADRPPRLLVVTTVPSMVRAFLLPWATYFRSRGWEVACAAAGAPGDAIISEAFDRAFDVPWTRAPKLRSLLKGGPAIRQVVQSWHPDVVHVHSPVAGWVTRWSLRHLGIPVVYTAHGFHFHRNGRGPGQLFYRLMERIAGRWTSALIVMNDEDEQAAHRLRIVPPDAIERIAGIGIDLQHFAPRSKAEARRLLAIPPEIQLVLMVSEFNPGKRHRDALRALTECPGVVLALAGIGPLQESTKKLAKALEIQHRVRFLGFITNVPDWLAASDVLIHPSEREGLPRTVMEAMALERPVVGAKARGTVDLLRDGRGFLVDVGDVKALAKALREALTQNHDVSCRVTAAREFIEHLDIAAVLRSHERLYLHVIESNQSAELR